MNSLNANARSRAARQKRQEALVKEWADIAVGTPVVVTMDDGTKFETRTRSEPWLVGGHSAVMLVEGIAGGYSLERFELAPSPSKEGTP